MRGVVSLRELVRTDSSEETLLRTVVETLPRLPTELFSVTARYAMSDQGIVPGMLVARGEQDFGKLQQAFEATMSRPPEFLGVDSGLTSTTQADSWNESAERAAEIAECQDFVGTIVEVGAGRFALAGAGTGERMPTPRQDARLYEAIGLLLGTNLRVRDALADASALESADAVFRADGLAVDVRDPDLQDRSSTRTLGDLVRDRESRDQFEPLDEASALVHWHELTRGGYVLLDHVDTDDRRYVIAFRMPKSPRTNAMGLSERERYVLERILLGARNKAIASELGVSGAHISGISQRALSKLGVDSPAALTRVMRARTTLVLHEFALGGEALIALGYRDHTADALRRLTSAERHVAHAVLDGRSHREIAVERGTSARTVASQVASIYRKLEVSGRRELTAKLSSVRHARS